MAEKETIITKTYDLLKFAIPILAKFPRDQRFLLGNQIQTLITEILDAFIEAPLFPKPSLSKTPLPPSFPNSAAPLFPKLRLGKSLLAKLRFESAENQRCVYYQILETEFPPRVLPKLSFGRSGEGVGSVTTAVFSFPNSAAPLFPKLRLGKSLLAKLRFGYANDHG